MEPLSLRELESEAQRRLDPKVYDFFAGGADDEVTLRENEAAFARIGLIPRVLRGRGNRKLEIDLLGCRTSMPVLLAPTAFHRLAHPQGESATARAAARAGTIMIVSMASTVAVEQIAAAAREVTTDAPANLWFQLYIQPDLKFTESIVRRAEAAGCTALVVSVDSPSFGRRERDVRNQFLDLPAGMCCENMREPLGEVYDISSPRGPKMSHTSSTGGPQWGRARPIAFSPELSWEHIDWLRKTTSLKIALKGIMHPSDAKLAVGRGVDALIVSNHGGHQLDTVPASIELLPAIVDAVEGRIPLLLDGGIRRGTDVVKALALGASAVAIGRPVLWGLALGGESGVSQVLELLRSELDRALALCGCGSPADLSRDLVRLRREEPCSS